MATNFEFYGNCTDTTDNQIDDYTLIDLDAYNSQNPDTDQTYVKTVSPLPFTSNTSLMNDSSIPIDTEGNIQCGQHCNVATNIDDILYHLTKDEYIPKLLELYNSNEELIASYRAKLAEKARACENPPLGLLKERRKSVKGPIVAKYAQDCYLLQQFLSGNTSDINHLFKATNMSEDNSLSQRKISGYDQNDLSTIKTTLANMQAEIHTLKEDSKQMKESIKQISGKVKQDTDAIKKELDSCAQILNKKLRNNNEASLSLTQCLSELSDKVKRLELSRNNLQTNFDLLDEIAKDNSRNICEILDLETQKRNDTKVYTKDLTDKVETLSKSSQYDRVNNEKSQRSIENKLKNLEAKMKNSPSGDNTAPILKSIADDITVKLDNLTTTMQNSLDCILNGLSSFEKPKYTETHSVSDQSGVNYESLNAPSDQTYNLTRTYHSKPNSENDKYQTKLTANTQQIPSIINNRPMARTKKPLHHQNATNYETDYEIIGLNDQPEPQNKFKGVLRRKGKPYLLTGITLDSNKSGLEQFLTDLGIVFKYVRFVQTRREDCLSAQIVVNEDQSEIVENRDTWPEGVFCRPWVPRSEYYNQRREQQHQFTE